MSGRGTGSGDLVQLRSGLTAIIISKKEIGAKNVVGRGGFVELLEVMTENGEIGQVLSHQVESLDSSVYFKE
jgi:hypothetical protein